jgi:type VI secretion system protein ImpF
VTVRWPRERLQPALLDRLEDGLQSARFRLRQARAALERLLEPAEAEVLEAWIADERRLMRPIGPQDLAPFARLDERGLDLVRQVVGLEQARVAEMQRGQVLSMERLRTAVRRDLEALLNTVHIEQHRVEGEDGEVALLDGFPQAAASVINYGLPPLTGRVRAQEDHEGIAAEIERAIQRFEPRIRDCRVTALVEDDTLGMARSPLAFLIEGELWGYPLSEQLYLRTVLDLEEGRATRPEPVAAGGGR